MYGESTRQDEGAQIELPAVRDALRAELTSRGHRVASDTLGLRLDLYIIGPNDLAKALFQINSDADLAAEVMYLGSGSWVEGMPPRFAVLPKSEASSPALEMLEQMHAIPLLFDTENDRPVFPELDALLAQHVDHE